MLGFTVTSPRHAPTVTIHSRRRPMRWRFPTVLSSGRKSFWNTENTARTFHAFRRCSIALYRTSLPTRPSRYYWKNPRNFCQVLDCSFVHSLHVKFFDWWQSSCTKTIVTWYCWFWSELEKCGCHGSHFVFKKYIYCNISHFTRHHCLSVLVFVPFFWLFSCFYF